MLPGWEFDPTGFGILDSRAVEVVGDRVLVSDGYDSRTSTDPMNHGPPEKTRVLPGLRAPASRALVLSHWTVGPHGDPELVTTPRCRRGNGVGRTVRTGANVT